MEINRNMRTNSCPCSGGSLLRHVRHNEVYWFCRYCWQEIPTTEAFQFRSRSRNSPSNSNQGQVLYSRVKKAPLVPCTWSRKSSLTASHYLSSYIC